MANARKFIAARSAWSVTGGDKPLPYDRKLKRLHSDGRQYIQTDILPKAGYGFSVDFEYSRIDTSLDPMQDLCNAPFGSDNDQLGGSGFGAFIYADYENACLCFAYIGLGEYSYIEDVIRKAPTSASVNFMNDSKSILNGVVLADGIPQSEKEECEGMPSIRIFGAHDSDELNLGYIGWISRLRISDHDNVIHDIVPVMTLDGEPAMYDEICGVMYKNAGEGIFGYEEVD